MYLRYTALRLIAEFACPSRPTAKVTEHDFITS